MNGEPAVLRTPVNGLPVWDVPGDVRRLVTELPPGVDVRLLQRDGQWALIEYEPGMTAWADARLLVNPMPAPVLAPSPAGAPAPPGPAGAKPPPHRGWLWALIGAACIVALVVVIVIVTRPRTSAAQTVATRITNVTSSVRRGDKATLKAATTPGANCSITVTYTTGPSHAKGLHAQSADSNGSVSWTWVVGSRTKPGTFPVKVSCDPGGSATSQITTS